MDGFSFATIAAVSGAATWRYTRGQPGTVRAVCCATLSASAMVVALVVCEVLALGSSDLRALLWRGLTASLLALLGFVFPSIYIWRLLDAGKRDWWRIAFFFSFYAAYLGGFYIVARKLPIERDDLTTRVKMTYGYALRQDMLACISFLGITMMAALCGVSSVSAPYTAFIYRPRPLTQADLAQLTTSITSTEDLIAAKELQVNRLQLQLRSPSRRSSSTNLVSKVFASLRPDDVQRELSSAQTELATMQKLRLELISDQATAAARLRSQAYAATVRGRIHAVLYAVFAIYCVYRVFNGYMRLIWWLMAYESREPSAGGPRDALVVALAKGAHHIWAQFTTDNWVRIIGALMSAAVFATSTSGMLRTLVRVKRIVKRRGASADSSLAVSPVLVANFVGIYVLAVATVLRLNIPKSMSGPILTALASPLRIASVQLLNDIVLSAASTVTILALFLSSRLEDDGSYDEEEKYE